MRKVSHRAQIRAYLNKDLGSQAETQNARAQADQYRGKGTGHPVPDLTPLPLATIMKAGL
jgi:hypothetical protein